MVHLVKSGSKEPLFFYVQDVRYAAGAWMHRSGGQDVRYAAGAWMRRSGGADVRYAAGAWMRRSGG